MPLPSVLSTIAVTPVACSCFWYQFIGMAGTPYRALDLLRAGAHEVDDGVGMITLEPGDHGFQHALVADVVRADDAEQADPRGGGTDRRFRLNPREVTRPPLLAGHEGID